MSTDQVREIIGQATVERLTVRLPAGYLPRPTFAAIAEIMSAWGGTWSRTLKAFSFDASPAEQIAAFVGGGPSPVAPVDVDQVAREILPTAEWGVTHIRPRGGSGKLMVHVCRLPTEVSVSTFNAVRDVLSRFGGSWNRQAQGFVFPIPPAATPWCRGGESAHERVAKWLRG